MSEIVLPFCEDIEEGLLGSLFVYPDALPAVREIVKASDFHIEVNRAVFAAMCKLADNDLAIEVRTVCAMLPDEIVRQTQRPLLEHDGGYDSRLARYKYDVPGMTTLSYARIVRALKVRRLAIRTLEKCLPHLLNWQEGKPVNETLDLLIEYLTGLRNGAVNVSPRNKER